MTSPTTSTTTTAHVAMTLRSRADAATDNPGRYAKQLVAHLGRRVAFTTTGPTSTATIGGAPAEITVGRPRADAPRRPPTPTRSASSSTSWALTWSGSGNATSSSSRGPGAAKGTSDEHGHHRRSRRRGPGNAVQDGARGRPHPRAAPVRRASPPRCRTRAGGAAPASGRQSTARCRASTSATAPRRCSRTPPG